MENKMGKQNMLHLLVTMSIPTIFSMFVISLYNIVDSYFISMIGEKAFRAVSLYYPIHTLIIALSVGTGIGANALIARLLGMDEKEEANKAANNALMLSVIIGLFIGVLGLLFTKTYFSMYSDDPEVIAYGVEYMNITATLAVFLVVQIMAEKIIQATGEMIYPMLSQLIGAVLNIILDPLLIFGVGPFPETGIAGAAAATVLSQIIGAVFCFVYLFQKEKPVHIDRRLMKPEKEIIKEIYRVGGPSIMLQAVPALLNFGLNKIFVNITELAVSVMGVYYKLQTFVFMPVLGLTQATMPIIAYNYGAKIKKRINDCLKYSLIISLSIMVIGTVLFWAIPEKLMGFFHPTEDLLALGVPALRIFATTFIPAAVSIILSTYYQALGNGVYSLIISVMRQLVIILPLAKIFSAKGIEYTWYAWPVAEVFTFLLSIYFAKRIYNKKVKNL